MIKKGWLLVSLFTLFVLNPAKAQEEDAALWTGLTLEKKLTQSFALNLSQEVRWHDNIREIKTVFTDLGADFNITPNVRITANYRFINKRKKEDYFIQRHRYYSDFIIKKKLSKRWSISNRIRYQIEKNFYDGGEDDVAEHDLREMLLLRYKTERKVKPYLGGEIFYRIPTSGLFDLTGSFNQYRIRTGFDYAINIHHNIDLFYMIKKDINVRTPDSEYVIGANYKFSF